MIEVPSILIYWYRCKKKNAYHIKSHHWKSIVSCRGTNLRLFAQYLFFRVVVFLLECYFLIKYLYSLRSNLKNVIHKKRTHICEVYFKNVVFLIIPLNYWNEAPKIIFHFHNFFAKRKGVHSMVIYWSKINSIAKIYTILAIYNQIYIS